MSYAVIVAKSRPQADLTAVIDWGWERTAEGYRDRDGNRVRYASRIEHFYGLPIGEVTIYQGYGWRDNPELKDLERWAAQRGWAMVDQPTTEHA